MAVGLLVSGGDDCLTWDGGTAGSQVNRYTCMMTWLYRTSAGSFNTYAISKENGVQIFASTTMVLSALWRIDGANQTAAGPTISINQWYHAATWFNHSTNQVTLRVWDATAKTVTNYTEPHTPTTWTLESATNPLNMFAQTSLLAGDMYGIVAGAKVWAPPGTSTQLSEAQIDLERYLLWPGYRPDLCTFWCPVWSGVAASSQLQYGTSADKTATAQGSFSAPTSQPPGLMQILPPMIARPQTRIRM